MQSEPTLIYGIESLREDAPSETNIFPNWSRYSLIPQARYDYVVGVIKDKIDDDTFSLTELLRLPAEQRNFVGLALQETVMVKGVEQRAIKPLPLELRNKTIRVESVDGRGHPQYPGKIFVQYGFVDDPLGRMITYRGKVATSPDHEAWENRAVRKVSGGALFNNPADLIITDAWKVLSRNGEFCVPTTKRLEPKRWLYREVMSESAKRYLFPSMTPDEKPDTKGKRR